MLVRFRVPTKRTSNPTRFGFERETDPGSNRVGRDVPATFGEDPPPTPGDGRWTQPMERTTKGAEEDGGRPLDPLREMGEGDDSGADNAVERRGPSERTLSRPLRQPKAAPRSPSRRPGGPDPSTLDDHTSEDPTRSPPNVPRTYPDGVGRRTPGDDQADGEAKERSYPMRTKCTSKTTSTRPFHRCKGKRTLGNQRKKQAGRMLRGWRSEALPVDPRGVAYLRKYREERQGFLPQENCPLWR